MTISSIVLEYNPTALGYSISSVWNIYKCQFTSKTTAYKDADKLANKIASNYGCEFSIYAVRGAIGRSGHSKSEIILIALKKGDELERCGRVYRELFSVSNSLTDSREVVE